MKKLSKLIMFLFIGSMCFMLSACGANNTNNISTVSEINNITESSQGLEEEIEDFEDYDENIEPVVREGKEVKSAMEILNIAGYRDTDKSTYIEIKFNKEIKDKFDLQPYIKFESGLSSFVVSKVEKKAIIKAHFDPRKKYNITILKGIKAVDGSMTKEDVTEIIEFAEKQPKIVFTNNGIILPSVNEKKIYIRSLNVKKLNVKVKKIYANNTTQFLQNFDFTNNGYYYGSFDNVGDILYDVNFDIENELDTWVQTAVDLTGVLDGNGIYMVEAKFDEKGTTYKFPSDMRQYKISNYLRENGRISKTILLTDVGIMAKKDDNGLLVNVLDIVNNDLIANAKVYLMSRNNQILEEKTTDQDGAVNFEDHKNTFYILVEHNDSKSILLLNNSLSTNGFAVDGVYATNGIRGYIYTERGVYRPGDPIYISIIARNNNEPLERKQPIKINIFDPTGVKMVDNDVVTSGKNGFYTYIFKTDISSRTGIWKLEATIGDEVLQKDISVETVAPNKIKVNVNMPDTIEYNKKATDWSISSSYLFGEPAGNLDYGMSFDIREEPVNFEKYKEYQFKLPSSYGYWTSKSLYGTLDEFGEGKIEPDFSDLKFGSVNLLCDVAGRVTDDGGRNVVTKKYVKIKKFDTYIGIENTDTYKKPGSELGIKAICVTEDGEKLVAGKRIKCRVYGNDYNWWWDYSDYDRFVRSFKSDKHTTLYNQYEFISQEVPTMLDYPLPKAEYVYVELEDVETGQMTGINLQSSEWVDPSIIKKVETLNISADKKNYNVGDVAKFKFKGAKNAIAIITIEKAGKILNQYAKKVYDFDMVEDLTITKEMAPNVYVYVTLIQDYKTKENDRPLRLYGVMPINVIDEDTKIDLQIDAPENIRPNEKFTVKIKNNNNKKFDFTIAVVDEGLLDITAFKTPTPWNYFYQKLAAKLSLYDNYSEIIDRPYGAVNQILKVGGDESLLDEMARRRRLKELGLEEADRFTPVSMFKGVLSSDENGEASIDFDMPNYMGSVRIMVVAANGNSYGSAEKNMIVKAPIIVQPTLPRTLKIGDKISIPVAIFALEEGLENIEVYYTFKGNTKTENLQMSKGDKKIIYFDDEIGNEIGKEKITVGARSNLYNYEETVGIAINSNNNSIEISENKELNAKENTTFTQNNEFVKGTVASVLTISNKMMLGLDQRLKYLIRYPYGCAEQTTSSIFPQLFIDNLSTTNDYKKEEVIDNINKGISRLSLFQLGDGSFSYWPGENYTSDYATNYIGHFLTYAKNNGYYVPDSMYNNWISYTSSKVRGTSISSSYDIDWKCYALYLLALNNKSNVSEMNYMFENYYKTNMSYTSKMYLAAAYKLAGEEKTAKEISSNINLSSVKKMFDDLYKRDRYYYNYSYGSKLREIAVYLDCYYTINGVKDDEAFDEVLKAMRAKDWYSTQTTAYSLLALSNIASENIGDTVTVDVEIDGVKTSVTADTKPARITLDENVKNIKVTSTTDKKTFINYYWEGVPINSEQEDYNEGFIIERNYYDDNGMKFDPTECKSGDTFWIEVIVKPKDRNLLENVENIAVSQILPSGWEIENLRVSDIKTPKWVEDKTKNTRVTYTDIRDDRIMWFFDYYSNPESKFFVKINAVTKGEYDFPGTSLEAMYDHNYRAYKKGNKVKVN